MKKVSIIIPMYNSEKFIRKTVDCCLNQSYPNIEIIIVDDGSTDNSYNIVKRHFNSSKILLLRIKNSGASTARNIALKAATGDYLMFLDSDDLISFSKIEQQVSTLEKQNNPLAISMCRWDYFEKSTIECKLPSRRIYHHYKSGKDLLIDLWNNNQILPVHCYLLPRKLIELVGEWNTSLTVNDDGEYFSRVLFNCGEVYFQPNVTAYYRRGDYDSLSKTTTLQKAEADFISLLLYKNILMYEDTQILRKALAKKFSMFIYTYYNRYPDLCKNAKLEIKKLSCPLYPVGTRKSIFLSKIIGLENFLKIKSLVLKYFKSN